MVETLEILGLLGYPSEIGKALWQLEDCRRRTLRVLEDLPEAYLDHEIQGNTIGTLLYHIALIELDWFFTEILEEQVPDDLMRLFPDEDRDEQGALTLIKGQTLAQHLDRLVIIRKTLLEKMQGMTSEDFLRTRVLPQYEVSPAWVLHHLSQHEAEHRGEIGSVISQIKKQSIG